MSFSAAWLGLREPYDLRARNAAVIDAVVVMLAGRPSVTIADLACGTGSTFRALRPRIKARQNWRLADNDLSLLARAPQSSPPDTHVTTMPVDLNRDLEAALDGPVDLVTTSALLDLVSDEWLQRLAVETAARRLPIYAALSYDGRIEMTPTGARAGRGSEGSRAVRPRRLFGGAGSVRLGVRADRPRNPNRNPDGLGCRGPRDG